MPLPSIKRQKKNPEVAAESLSDVRIQDSVSWSAFKPLTDLGLWFIQIGAQIVCHPFSSFAHGTTKAFGGNPGFPSTSIVHSPLFCFFLLLSQSSFYFHLTFGLLLLNYLIWRVERKNGASTSFDFPISATCWYP